MIATVVDWPGVSETAFKPATVRSAVDAAVSVTVSGSLPALVSVIVELAATPGGVITSAGSSASVTASIAGMTKVAVCVWLMEESVVLVAVTVNKTCVPARGAGPVPVGITYRPTMPTAPAGTATLVRLGVRAKPPAIWEKVSSYVWRPGPGSGSSLGKPRGPARH